MKPPHIVHGSRNRIVPNYVPLVGLKKIIIPPVMLVRDWTVGSITRKRNLSFIISLSLRHRRNETSGYVRLRKSAEILVLGPSCVPGFEYLP